MFSGEVVELLGTLLISALENVGVGVSIFGTLVVVVVGPGVGVGVAVTACAFTYWMEEVVNTVIPTSTSKLV